MKGKVDEKSIHLVAQSQVYKFRNLKDLKKSAIPGLFFFIFVFSKQLTEKMFHIKVC